MKNLLEFIPFLNLYPIWAQIIVLICLVIVTVLLIFVPRNAPATKESSVIRDSGVQATTTGDNSPIVGRDYVAGDKIVNKGPSLEDIKAAMREVEQEKAEYLHMEYGSKYTVGAITPERFVGPKGDIPSGIEVKWDTGKVLEFTEKSIKVLLPNMIINTESVKRTQIPGATVTLPKKINAKLNLISWPEMRLQVEVIGLHNEMVTIGIGFIPINNEDDSNTTKQ